MRIVDSAGSPAIPSAPIRRHSSSTPLEEAEHAGRALIALEALVPSERPRDADGRPLAAFLAHLIATKAKAPQTRQRRRAEPEEAMAHYAAAAAAMTATGRSFARRA